MDRLGGLFCVQWKLIRELSMSRGIQTIGTFNNEGSNHIDKIKQKAAELSRNRIKW